MNRPDADRPIDLDSDRTADGWVVGESVVDGTGSDGPRKLPPGPTRRGAGPTSGSDDSFTLGPPAEPPPGTPPPGDGRGSSDGPAGSDGGDGAHFPPGTVLGEYRLDEFLGKGAMGEVYRAHHAAMDRAVAVKVILSGRGPGGTVGWADVRREAVNAGRLDHPGIVRIHEFREAGGHPFIAMELVAGRTLDEVPVDRDVRVRCRRGAALAAQAAAALAHAHDPHRRVLHLDVKPSNLMLSAGAPPDDRERLRVLDFGVSVLRNGATGGGSGRGGGTLHYMPPERFGPTTRLDPTGDVFSLGVTLWERLVGRRLRPPGTISQAYAAAVHAGRHPVPPPAGELAGVPADLSAVVAKATAHDPADRYPTCAEFHADLAAWLDGRETTARRWTRTERLHDWRRRHPARAVAAAACAVLLAVMAFGLVRQTGLRADAERATAAAQRTAAAEAVQRDRAERESRRAAEQAARADRNAAAAQLEQARLAQRLAAWGLDRGERQDASARLRDVPPSARGWDTRRLAYRAGLRPTITRERPGFGWPFLAAAASPDGRRLATADASGTLAVWDVMDDGPARVLIAGRENPEARRVEHHHLGRPPDSGPADWDRCAVALAWTPGGPGGRPPALYAACGNGELLRYADAAGDPAVLLQPGPPLTALAAAADGSRVLTGGADGTLALLDADGRAVTGRDPPAPASDAASGAASDAADDAGGAGVTSLAADPRGAGWFVGRADGTVAALSGGLEPAGAAAVPGPVWALAARPDGDAALLAVGGGSAVVRLLRAGSTGLSPAGEFARGGATDAPAAIHALAFARGGSELLAGDSSGTVAARRVADLAGRWSAATEVPDPRLTAVDRRCDEAGVPRPPISFRRVVAALVPRGDGTFVSVGQGGDLRVWSAAAVADDADRPDRPDVRLGRNPRVASVPGAPDRLWGLGDDGVLHLVGLAAGRTRARVSAHPPAALDPPAADLAPLPRVVKSSAARSAATHVGVATVGGEPAVRLWRTDGERVVPADPHVLAHDRPLVAVAASPDGRHVAAVDDAGGTAVWALPAGDRVFHFAPAHDPRRAARPLTGRCAFNPDGTRLAAFGSGQTGWLFTIAADGTVRRDDRTLEVAGAGGVAFAWNPRRPGLLHYADTLPMPRWASLGASLGAGPPDVPRLTPPGRPTALFATPDGRRIVRLARDGTAAFLSTDPVRHVDDLRTGLADAVDAVVTPDGRRLVVADAAGRLAVWDTGPAPIVPDRVADETADWAHRPLFAAAASLRATDERLIAADARGRLCVVAVEIAPSVGKGEVEGRLLFAREDLPAPESLADDGAVERADARVQATGAVLTFTPDGWPLLVHRRRTGRAADGSADHYAGDVRAAVRSGTGSAGTGSAGTGRWAFETLSVGENDGFYPVPVPDADGRFATLLHYSFDGRYLSRTRPDPGGGWRTDRLGRQGDGLSMCGTSGRPGVVHLLFNAGMPYAKVPTYRRYAATPAAANSDAATPKKRGDGRAAGRAVAADRSVRVELGVHGLPDGRPVVLGGGSMKWGARPNTDVLAGGRPADGITWEVLATLPVPVDRLLGFAVAPDGGLWAADWDTDRPAVDARRDTAGRLRLWRGAAGAREVGDWAVAHIAGPFPEGRPALAAVRFAPDGTPVIAVGRLLHECLTGPAKEALRSDRRTWLRVLRPRR